MAQGTEHLVSLEEVAAYIGKTPAAVYQMRHRGDFAPGYRVGKTVRFRMSQVDEWLESKADPAPRSAA